MANDEHKEQRLGLWLAGGAAGLAAAATLFFTVWGWETGRIEGSPNNANASAVVMEEVSAAEEGKEEAAVEQAVVNGMVENSASETVAPADVAPAEASASMPSENEAAVVVENGIVKFYFASGKSDLAAGAEDALKDVLAGVKAGKKAVVSGFHDKTGNQALNEELSKQRAFAVKNALMGLGVAENQIELHKPSDSEGSGSKAEARRVEVGLE